MKRREMLGAAIGSITGVAAAAATAAAGADSPAPPPYQERVRIPMRDGVQVAASLWLPFGRRLDPPNGAITGCFREP